MFLVAKHHAKRALTSHATHSFRVGQLCARKMRPMPYLRSVAYDKPLRVHALPTLFPRFASSSHSGKDQKQSSNSSAGDAHKAYRAEFQDKQRQHEKNMNIVYIALGVTIMALGLSYLSVPLYRIFCQVTGFGGIPQDDKGGKKLEEIVRGDAMTDRQVQVTFVADSIGTMPWKFVPIQNDITLSLGETCLAFYNATNLTKDTIVGVATYNVFPSRAALYFHKVQCFCFDEQRLGPEESVDMPVFFFLDPEFAKDKYLKNCEQITLSYTFFPVEEEIDDCPDDDDD